MAAMRLFSHVKDLCERELFVPAIYFKNSTALVVHDYHVAEKLKENPTYTNDFNNKCYSLSINIYINTRTTYNSTVNNYTNFSTKNPAKSSTYAATKSLHLPHI